MKTKWMIIPVVALVLGCTREIDTNVTYVNGEFSLYATSGENETRTVIQQDGLVFWSPSDCINVFYGDMSGKFTSTNTEVASSAEFSGSLGTFVLDGETEFKAIYPYSAGNSVTGDTFNLSLPSEQVAVEGTFADDLFINVAKSKDYNLHFYNVCGGVKFSLARDDIKKVVFRGNNGEILAGCLSVEFVTEQIPSVSNVDNGKTSVTLVAPDGGTFRKGAFYYIVLVPQVLRQGYTMELYADNLVETVSSDSSAPVRRSAWGVLKNLGSKSSVTVPEAIDLGLPSGIKWASFNLGASKPEENGDYYAWGETEIKSEYSWENYKWSKGSEETLTKYCDKSKFGYNGYTDNLSILEPNDDAAHVNLGGKWRMPTSAECSELLDNCDWVWEPRNGVKGFRVTSKKNGRSIFLPAGGSISSSTVWNEGIWGHIPSSSLDIEKDDGYGHQPYSGDGIMFGIGWGYEAYVLGHLERCIGNTIRPVYDDSEPEPEMKIPEAIDLGLPSGLKWANMNLGASKPEEYGDYFAWGETEPYYYSQDPLIWKPGKEAGYTWETYKWCMGSMNTMTKYCLNADKGYNGFTDDKTVLDPEDDAAHVNLGGNWRMPTLLEQKELVDNCTGEWVSQNGVYGMLVMGPNGNNIFLPAAGYRYGNFTSPISTSSYGCYWSTALFEFEPYETYEADELWIYSDGLLHWYTIIERLYGCSIRPVYDDSQQEP